MRIVSWQGVRLGETVLPVVCGPYITAGLDHSTTSCHSKRSSAQALTTVGHLLMQLNGTHMNWTMIVTVLSRACSRALALTSLIIRTTTITPLVPENLQTNLKLNDNDERRQTLQREKHAQSKRSNSQLRPGRLNSCRLRTIIWGIWCMKWTQQSMKRRSFLCKPVSLSHELSVNGRICEISIKVIAILFFVQNIKEPQNASQQFLKWERCPSRWGSRVGDKLVSNLWSVFLFAHQKYEWWKHYRSQCLNISDQPIWTVL